MQHCATGRTDLSKEERTLFTTTTAGPLRGERLDAKYHRTPHGVVGVVGRALAAYGRVQGLVWGQWSGASEAVHALAKLTVATAAAKKWKYMGCRSYGEATGILTAQLRVRWGTVAALARARLLVSRVRTLTIAVHRKSVTS